MCCHKAVQVLALEESGTAVTFMLRDYCWGDVNEKEREELLIPSLSSTLVSVYCSLSMELIIEPLGKGKVWFAEF